MQGNILGQSGGGLKINGIIEEYKVASGGKVNAGDFVKYLNKEVMGTDTQLSTSTGTGNEISAVELSENEVFIAHTTAGSAYQYLRGTVVIIKENTIDIKIDSYLSTGRYSASAISAIKLSSNKIFIAHLGAHDTATSAYLSGMIVTIENEQFTTSVDTRLTPTNYLITYMSAVRLSENKVFITYSKDSNNYLNGIVATIEGNIITAGTDTQLSTSTGTGSGISAVELSENKVFIAHRAGDLDYLYGMVCTINELVISINMDKQLSTTKNTGNNLLAVNLTGNKVFIAHNNSNSLYGIIVTVRETTIEIGTDTQVCEFRGTGEFKSAARLSMDRIAIAHSYYSNNYLFLTIVKINGTTIEIDTDIKLSESANSGKIISTVKYGGNIFIAHSIADNSSTINFYLGGIAYFIDTGIKTITSNVDEILGIAKTKGTEGEIVRVYTPKLLAYLSTEDGNRIISENGEEIRNE